MNRGEVWTASAGGDYVGKPRPVVIVQDDAFDETASITICSFTTNPVEAPLFRLHIEAEASNGLREPSRLMVDKVTTVPRTKLGSGSAGWPTQTSFASTARWRCSSASPLVPTRGELLSRAKSSYPLTTRCGHSALAGSK